MALPFLSGLSPLARSAFPIVQRGVREGLTSQQIQTAINRGLGSGIRRQTLLDMIRNIKGIESAGAQLKFLKSTATPNPLRIPEALHVIRRAYSFQVSIKGYLSNGEAAEQFMTVSTDELMTRSQLEDMAASFVDTGQSGAAMEVESVTLISAVRAGRSGSLSNPQTVL